MTQSKVLAKKGIWVSEFRIESGLNCGGHAFAPGGYAPVLDSLHYCSPWFFPSDAGYFAAPNLSGGWYFLLVPVLLYCVGFYMIEHKKDTVIFFILAV